MEQLIENLDLEEMNYYYHITSKGYSFDILENGLYLEKDDLRSTTIKIDVEMLENFENYCSREYADGLVKRQEMVIIGCLKGDEKFLVEKTDIPHDGLNYLIRSENILGYIDLKTLEVIYNSEYIHNYTI